MANRFAQQFTFSLVKQVYHIFARVNFGAAGAPTLVQGVPAASPGVVSVTKGTSGRYTFVFGTQAGMLDVWPRFLGARVHFVSASAAPAAPILYTVTNATATPGTCSITVECLDYAGAAANPASGEVGYFEFIFSNSTAT